MNERPQNDDIVIGLGAAEDGYCQKDWIGKVKKHSGVHVYVEWLYEYNHFRTGAPIRSGWVPYHLLRVREVISFKNRPIDRLDVTKYLTASSDVWKEVVG